MSSIVVQYERTDVERALWQTFKEISRGNLPGFISSRYINLVYLRDVPFGEYKLNLIRVKRRAKSRRGRFGKRPAYGIVRNFAVYA